MILLARVPAAEPQPPADAPTQTVPPLAASSVASPTRSDPVATARALLGTQRPAEALALLQPLLAPVANGKPASPEILLLAGDAQAALGATAAAEASYRSVTQRREPSPCRSSLAAWERLAELALRTGRCPEAEAALARAAELYGPVTIAELTAAGATGYQRNRAALDAVPEYAAARFRRLAATHEVAGRPLEAALAWEQALRALPRAPDSRDVARRVAERRQDAGIHVFAIPFYLRVLDLGEDRCFTARAALPENQRYLETVTQPPSAAVVEAALAGLNACEERLSRSGRLSPDALTAFAADWLQALAASFAVDPGPAVARWRALARAVPAEPWPWLCALAAGQCLLLEGRWIEAREAFAGVTADGAADEAYAMVARFGEGCAAVGMRDSARARHRLEEVATATDRTLAADAMLELALLAETDLAWARAEAWWRRLQEGPGTAWHHRQAEFARTRVAELRCLASRRDDNRLAVLPDDRTTRGDWPLGYGAGGYVLCGQNYVTDVTGGTLGTAQTPLPDTARPGPQSRPGHFLYGFRTMLPSEPGRCWVSKPADTDPTVLWDPNRRTRVPANRDDYGEQHPLGTGPDVVLECTVPAGAWVLSLYFVNDYNYYEPDRVYSISVTAPPARGWVSRLVGRPPTTDGTDLARCGDLLAVTDVRAFGGGVYKRFAVRGPQRLCFRVWRNLSINTLVSGVFLDPLGGLAAAPDPAGQRLADPRTGRVGTGPVRRPAAGWALDPSGPPPSHLPRPLGERMLALARRLERRPLATVADTAALGALAESLADETRGSADSQARAEALWYRREVLRLQGRHQDADALLDAYLAALLGTCSGTQVADVGIAVVRTLFDRTGDPWLAAAALRVYPDGQAPARRAWDACTQALVRLPAGPGLTAQLERIVDGPAPYVLGVAREKAGEALLMETGCRRPPAAVLAAAAFAFRQEGAREPARRLLQRAIEAGPAAGDAPVLLAELIECQVGLHAPLGEIEAVYARLLACPPASARPAVLRNSLLLVASACAERGAWDRALAVLESGGDTLRNDPLARSLRPEWERRRQAAGVARPPGTEGGPTR